MTDAGSFIPLGIVAGGGALPKLIADACAAQGRRFHVIVLDDQRGLADYSGLPHTNLPLGKAGGGAEIFRKNCVEEVVVCGYVDRPKLATFRPDVATAWAALSIGVWGLGERQMLKGLARYIEGKGFRLVGADTLLTDLVTPNGFRCGDVPDTAWQDLAFAYTAAKEAGERDDGQGAIVVDGRVIASETEDGTDAMLESCANAGNSKGGVLVKAVKPGQDRRIDLPVIGAETVERAAQAGLVGIGLEAGASMMITPETVAKSAQDHGIFIVAMSETDIG